jgi:hypothetical protein
MSVNASIKNFRVIPLSRTPAKILLKWDIQTTPGEPLTDYEIYILRAESQDAIPNFQHVKMMTHNRPEEGLAATDGRSEIITPEIKTLDSKNMAHISRAINAADLPWYLDSAQSLQMLNKPVYYKLIVRKISTQESIESNIAALEGDLDVVGMYVVDETNFLLEDVVGVPSLVYQRKRSGVLCTKCFDPIQKKRMISQCGTCYGTNWVGGFYNPIDCYIDYSPNPKTVQIAQWGEMQPNETQILMSNFPELSPGDVIHEIRQGRLWRVVQVTETEKRRVPMLQFARVTEIKPSDIENSISHDARFAVQKMEELEQIKRRREF